MHKMLMERFQQGAKDPYAVLPSQPKTTRPALEMEIHDEFGYLKNIKIKPPRRNK